MDRSGVIRACGLATLLLLAGCGGAVERDPYVMRARDMKQRQMIDESIALYNKALARKPGLAAAHMELGILYEQYRDDPVRAIYHYERFLELDPDAERKSVVQDLIRQARIKFAASLPDRPSEAIREIDALRKENAVLRSMVDNLQRPPTNAATASTRAAQPARTNRAAAVSHASGSPAGSASVPATAAPATYEVQPGDTLHRIAVKVYGDAARWQKIYDANREKLSTPQSLRVGQTLSIPPAAGGT
jgi:LysM repeat protein